MRARSGGVAAGYEKFHDVVALGFGVPALQLTKSRGGIKRFEGDRKKNRKRLAELGVSDEAAEELRSIDEQIFNHRFLELRNQLTHSLAPILEWRSLIWFEVGVIVDGGVIGYEGRYLTPGERIQEWTRRQRSCSTAPWPTAARSSHCSSP